MILGFMVDPIVTVTVVSSRPAEKNCQAIVKSLMKVCSQAFVLSTPPSLSDLERLAMIFRELILRQAQDDGLFLARREGFASLKEWLLIERNRSFDKLRMTEGKRQAELILRQAQDDGSGALSRSRVSRGRGLRSRAC
jgi:hypothetical protein